MYMTSSPFSLPLAQLMGIYINLLMHTYIHLDMLINMSIYMYVYSFICIDIHEDILIYIHIYIFKVKDSADHPKRGC
jgi:hypothetical protein